MNNKKIKNFEQRMSERNKIVRSVSMLFILFFLIAILGVLFGNFLDKKFDIKPWGNIISLFVGYVATWVIIYWYYKKHIVPFTKGAKSKDKNK